MSSTQDVFKFNSKVTYTTLPAEFYSECLPEKVSNPTLLCWNSALAKELGISSDDKGQEVSAELAAYFSGNKLIPGSQPLAQAYAGHQFGYFNVLGDGRAVLLGEQITTKGNRVDIQLKGAGRTKYSRNGDGRATNFSMLREYLISEAMHALGMATSRSLAVVSTGDAVYRNTEETGAVLTRVSSSHLRVGTFEYAARTQPVTAVKQLADYAIERHYSHLLEKKGEASFNLYLSFYKEVMAKQIETVTNWVRVGFIHGVMNTDNVSISGETIDYGPCAFLNNYDPKKVFSSIDTKGRYAFGNQGRILLWNLARFVETLLPLLDDDQEKAIALAQVEIDNYAHLYDLSYWNMMRGKFGMVGKVKEGDLELINEFLEILEKGKLDYTNAFLSLEQILVIQHKSSKEVGVRILAEEQDELTLEIEKGNKGLSEFIQKWKNRVSETAFDSVLSMQKHNPRIIPRNHLVESALATGANQNDFQEFDELLNVCRSPYANDFIQNKFQCPPQEDGGYQTFCGT